jgi:hypothetical protein
MSQKFSYESWPRWFASIWPDSQKRWAIINGYRVIGVNHPNVLADIALRNNVFAPIRESDPHRCAIAEGRRQCALEIFKLANIDPATLFDRTQVDRKSGDQK